MLKVFGHKNPDTDATCSAIAYAWYLSAMEELPAAPYVLGEVNREAAYVLDRFGYARPEILSALVEGDEVVIVDTNNPEELPDLTATKIVEVVDHHKLVGGLSTAEPIPVTIRPLACTATVLWEMMDLEDEEVPAELAGLMLAAILSDTLNFSSPTATEADREAAEDLARIAKVDMDELAEAMFAAKSDLTGMAPRDLLLADSKAFAFGGKKVRISSLETVKPENALALQDELVTAMAALKDEEGLDGLYFFVVDILGGGSRLLVASEEERQTAERAFGLSAENGILNLPGVVSRKKQMVPPLEREIGKA